jgi:hypothetical protein
VVGGLADQVGAVVDAASAGLAADSAPPSAEPAALAPANRRRDVVVGLVFETQDLVGGAVERFGSVMGPWTGWVWRSPAVGPVRRIVQGGIDDLARRGAVEQAEAKALTAGVVDTSVSRVAASSKLPDTVDEVVAAVLPGILDSALPVAIDKLGAQPELIEGLVDGILEGILDSALPVAIDKLANHPDLLLPVVVAILPDVLDEALPVAIDRIGDQQEAIREVVRSSSDSIGTEVANTVRSRTVRGDEVVERIARRLTLRRTRPVFAPRGDLAGPLSPPGPVAELAAVPESETSPTGSDPEGAP